MRANPHLPVEAFTWEEIGEEDPKSRLFAQLRIGDCWFHVDARQVVDDPDGFQTVLDYPDDFEKCQDMTDNSRFMTLTVDGRDYFVFILPHGA